MQYRPLFTYESLWNWKINIDILWTRVDIDEKFFFEEVFDDLREIESDVWDILDKILS